ncbi:MAG: hypothetical protein ACFFCS_04855 [Candidatus Hodarchaeota archaeon]
MSARDGNLSGFITNYMSPRCVAFFMVMAIIWFIYIFSYSIWAYITQLSFFGKNVLWYVVAFSVFLIAVLWVVYRRAKSKTYVDDRPATEYSRRGSEPTIGDTYRYRSDDQDKRNR